MNLRKWFGGVVADARTTIDIDEHGKSEQLVRHLGLFSIVVFTVTQAVGAGILTTPGIIATKYAGSWGFLSFLWAGLIVIPPAMCIAYNASRSGSAGSTGSYASKYLGQYIGFLMFVDVMLECVGGTAAVAVSQADHILLMAGVKQGDVGWWSFWTTTPVHGVMWGYVLAAMPIMGGGLWAVMKGLSGFRVKVPASRAIGTRMFDGIVVTLGILAIFGGAALTLCVALPSINLLSVAVVAAVTLVLLRGIKETAMFTNVFTGIKLLTLAAICVLLGLHFDWALINQPLPAGLPGTLAGASGAFFAYVGLDLATTSAGETKNPKRNVPLGMLLGAVLVMILYVLASACLNGSVPLEVLAKGEHKAAPFANALIYLGYDGAAWWVALGSTVAMVSVVLASAYSTTRLLFNISQHRLLPAWFEQVSTEKTWFWGKGVPVVATLTVFAFISFLTALLDVEELMHLTNIGTMTAFITVSAIVLVNVIRETNWRSIGALKGGFWGFVALLGIAGPARLMAELPIEAYIRLGVVWTLVTIVFVFYSRHRSLARLHTPKP
ncbi:MAG: amino acid permease [Candidatus Obscuribacterales bacterium]|nr:amino acid permease [Candidatus Obscuribacterales bacterium]